MLGEQPADRDLQLLPPRVLRRPVAVAPFVEPRRADRQRPARGRLRDLMVGPLGGDEPSHGYRPIASFTQRATERLSTSRSIRSSMSSFRSRSSSARSDSLSSFGPFSPARRCLAHQLPRVPSLMPSSRATCAIGFPVSNTSRTAPCLKSSSNLRYLPTPPLRLLWRCLHATRGNPDATASKRLLWHMSRAWFAQAPGDRMRDHVVKVACNPGTFCGDGALRLFGLVASDFPTSRGQPLLAF